jgi:DNA-binding transcriptional MerR regulator
MYTIKQAAARAGVSVPVMRAWERRYGVVHPTRTPAGYRVYDEPAIARVRAMRRLVDDGWSPNAAAERIKEAAAEELQALVSRPAVEPPAHDSADLRDAFVAAAAALDAARVEAVLDQMFASGSFEQVAEHQLLPALHALGEAWADGRVDVAAEHAASHAVLRRLSGAYQAAGRPAAHAGAILVGLPPGARHELGALAFSVVARRAGLPILYLGPDVPLRDWMNATRATGAPAVVIGVVSEADREAAEDVASALLAADPEVIVALGGSGAQGSELIERRGVLVLPDGVVDAAQRLVAALGARRSTMTVRPVA